MLFQLKVSSAVCWLLLSIVDYSWNCGSITHMEIALRAMEYFSAVYKGLDIRQLAAKHPEALHAGSVYPDSYYDVACYSGKFHDTSETTHWMQFVIAALNYFNEKYESKPIDEPGEKLLMFIFGIISHDVADVLWHSLGIDQGFIDTMAQVNFNGNYQSAHSIADPGGDSVNLYEMNLFGINSSVPVLRWYVPVQDMLAVYLRMGIAFNESIIKTCAIDLMQLEAAGEFEVFEKLYPIFMSKSAFVGSTKLTGGLNEMAFWTMQRWVTALMYISGDDKNCTNTQGGNNPFYWVCGNQSHIKPPSVSWLPSWQRPGLYSDSTFHQNESRLLGVAFDEIKRRKTAASVETTSDNVSGGYYFDLKITKQIHKLDRTIPKRSHQPSHCETYDYFISKPYSLTGQTLLSADVNGDSYDDLVVGVPEFSWDNNFQVGRIFIVLGDRNGLPSKNVDLIAVANFSIPAPFDGEGRFGYNIAVLDFNDDSLSDLVVSAPLYSPDVTNMLYSGQVYIYYGKADGRFGSALPDITIDCKLRFCNFGTSLSIGDINHDGKHDLIIGSPYATQSFNSIRQNGFVAAYFSRRHPKYEAVMDVIENGEGKADIFLWGPEPYSWFGYSAVSTPKFNLLIGAPARTITQSGMTMQMAGTVYCYEMSSKKLSIFAEGSKQFENFGAALSVGFPNGRNSPPIIAVSGPNNDVSGKHFGVVPFILRQCGTVYLFDEQNATLGKQQEALSGDRHYGAFGRFIKFVDTNSDGFDDLLVGAPIRQPKLLDSEEGEAVGELFLFYGSQTFPQNNLARHCKGDITPCPEDQADGVFAIGTNRAQFGSNAAVIRAEKSAQFVVAAQRSDQYAKQAGKLVLFDRCSLVNPSFFPVIPFSFVLT